MKRLRSLGLALSVLLAAVVAASPSLGAAQSTLGLRGGSSETANGSFRVDLSNQTSGVHMLAIPRGQSAIVDLPMDARDVMVGNPAVAEPIMRTPRRISILGVAPGQTDATFFDANGRRILSLNIRVDQNISGVADTLNRLIPDARIKVDGVNNSLVLSGQVANLADATKAVEIAQQFTAKPEQVLNMLSIAGKDQVMLRVRVIEVQRSVVKQLGFNLGATYGQSGLAQFAFSTAASFAVNGSLLGGLNAAGATLNTTQQPELQVPCATGLTGTCYQVVHGAGSGIANYNTATTQTTAGSTGLNKANGTIDAFERVGLVRTLAEPNLTAVSGESANFLAGGEFPVPSGLDQNGRVTIEFKSYGVGLGFTPVVLSGGRMSLKISTEVSALSDQGAFTLSNGVGTAPLTIPGLTVRRTQTTVEMPSGGSMMISGLLQSTTQQDLDSLPGLMTLPVLGALFRSQDYLSGETELVVIVTPYIVSPTSGANLQTPADGLQIANDVDTTMLGHMNKVYKAKPDANAGRTYQGPVGYVIE